MKKIFLAIIVLFVTLNYMGKNLPSRMYFGNYVFYNSYYGNKGTMKCFVADGKFDECISVVEAMKQEKEEKWNIQITSIKKDYNYVIVDYNIIYKKSFLGVSVMGMSIGNPHIMIQILPIDFGYGKAHINPLIPFDSFHNGVRTTINDFSSVGEISLCGFRFSGAADWYSCNVSVLDHWPLQQYANYYKFGFDFIRFGWCNDSYWFNQSLSVYPFVENIECTTYDGSGNRIGWTEQHYNISREFGYFAKYWGVGISYRISFLEFNVMLSDFQKTFYVSGVIPLSSIASAFFIKNNVFTM